MKPTAIDLFAGAGGTSLGLRLAGFKVIAAVEIDEAKVQTFSANHPETPVLGPPNACGDVRMTTAGDLRAAGSIGKRILDLLVACPPCQGYSVRGKKNSKDPRNQLYLEFVRLAKALRPRSVVFENVPGILSLYDGRFLEDLLGRLERIGYSTVMWRIKASEVGVPQARQRIFVVGIRDGSLGSRPRSRREVTVWDAIADIPVGNPREGLVSRLAIPYKRDARSRYALRLRAKIRKVTSCEPSAHAVPIVKRFRKLRWNQKDPTTGHRRLHPRMPSFTLTAGSRSLTALRPVHPFSPRVLTVREAARLSSFPDWYEFSSQTAEAWSQIGNAVPPTMAEAVFSRVRSFLA